MAERNLRGSRLSSTSLHDETGVIPADRQRAVFHCAHCGNEQELAFALEVELPAQWECRRCGQLATRQTAEGPVEVEAEPAATGRTHWDMLLERRSIAELEELLEERLALLRARRGESIGKDLLDD